MTNLNQIETKLLTTIWLGMFSGVLMGFAMISLFLEYWWTLGILIIVVAAIGKLGDNLWQSVRQLIRDFWKASGHSIG